MKKILLRASFGVVILGSLAGLSAYTYQSNTPENIVISPATGKDIKLPAGFSATVLAEGIGPARHLAVSKKGDIYVKLGKLKDGKGLVVLQDTNKDGKIDKQTPLLDYPGTGIAIKNGYLYSASNNGVFRYKLNANEEIESTGKGEKIVYGLVEKMRDVSKSITLDDNGNIYVSVGSYNDACREPGELGKGMMPCPLLDSVGGIWQFKADRLNQSYGQAVHYGIGNKNAVGLDWNKSTNSLFAMQHGRGQFHDKFPQYYTAEHTAKLPAETMYEVKKGTDAGWPYMYYDHIQKKKMLAPEYGGDGKKTGGEKAADPIMAFPAHLAPNALLFYTGNMFPAKYKNGAFIAFHGKSSELQKGYLVAFVPFKNGKPSGNYEIFADNFAGVDLVKPTGPIQHRPCGLAQGPDGALYVSDDLNGSIFRIDYKGKK